MSSASNSIRHAIAPVLVIEDEPSVLAFISSALERNGFPHVTTLWYMRHPLELPGRLVSEERLTYQTYTADPGLLQRTLLLSYEETRDCPEVNGVRDQGEILEGHRSQGRHDPSRWWLALNKGEPIGVLLATEVPEWNAWEISYVGVVPGARRRGYGREMTCKAISEARAAGVAQLTLSVDTRNEPAKALYLNLGFQPFDEREVYLAVWKSGP